MPSPLAQVPTAPHCLPLLGHGLRLWRGPLRFLASLREIGPLVRVVAGRWPLYVVTTPEAVHQVFVSQARHFTKGALFDRLRPLLGNGLITSSGEFHRDQRRRVQPAFTRQRLADYSIAMTHHATRLAQSWRPGQTVVLTDALTELTFATVAEVIFSATTNDTAALGRSMADLNDGILHRAFLPHAVTRLPLTMNRRYNAAVHHLHTTIRDTIANRRHEPTHAGDLLSALLQPGPDGRTMPEHQIRDEIITIMLAGAATTATVLSWACHHLAEHTHLEQHISQELCAAMDNRTAQRPAPASHTHRFLLEVLRLHPLALVMRRAHEPTVIADTTIPPDTEIIISPYTMHRDPHHYPRPHTFDPQRWQRTPPEHLPKGAFIPFSDGNRKCVGDQFAWTHMISVLHAILHRWQLNPTAGHTASEVLSIHPHLDRLSLTLTPRHPNPAP